MVVSTSDYPSPASAGGSKMGQAASCWWLMMMMMGWGRAEGEGVSHSGWGGSGGGSREGRRRGFIL